MEGVREEEEKIRGRGEEVGELEGRGREVVVDEVDESVGPFEDGVLGGSEFEIGRASCREGV